MKSSATHTFFLIVWIIASCHAGYAAQDEATDSELIARQSAWFGKLEKEKAAEIIESCAEATYETNAIVTSTKFYMGIPKVTSWVTPGIRTITKFEWSQVKEIEAGNASMRITYESSLLTKMFDKKIELRAGSYTQPDIAAALFTLTGKPLPEKIEQPPVIEPELPAPVHDDEPQKAVKEEQQRQDLKSRLKKLKELYEEGLISKEVYDSKQNELLESLSQVK